MKKKIGVLLIATLVMTCACSKTTGTMTCTNEVKNGNYVTKLEAVIDYSDGYVDKLTTTEEVTTDNDKNANDFKLLLDNYYISYNKIDGFSNTVEVKNKLVISKTIIDYKNIDTDALIKIDETNANLINDGKLSIDDLKKSYTIQGARCK